jgi:hypothetical protein
MKNTNIYGASAQWYGADFCFFAVMVTFCA